MAKSKKPRKKSTNSSCISHHFRDVTQLVLNKEEVKDK